MKISFTPVFLLLCLLIAVRAPAQYYTSQNKVWAMSRYVGLDFNNGEPEVITTSIYDNLYYEEACASVCDEQGNLLFYTNGTVIWDATGSIMPNGTYLFGNSTYYSSISATQGALILPDPGNAKRFYVFTLTSLFNPVQVLFSNVVDMTLNGGLGDVDVNYALRGVVLQDSLTEKMLAIKGCNDGVWLLTKRMYAKSFEAYAISAAGINTTPVVSNTGSFDSTEYGTGAMKINNAGNKLAVCCYNGGMELCDFDPATGMVSNAQVVGPPGNEMGFYSAAFSPDDTKLYACATGIRKLVQYDLSTASPNPPKTILTPLPEVRDLRLAPDGRIYLGSRREYTVAGSLYISRINAPNSAGVACDFQDTIPGLNFVAVAPMQGGLKAGLPPEVVITESRLSNIKIDTVYCKFPGPRTLYGRPGYTNYQWDNGSSTPNRTVTQQGTYWVRYWNTGCGIAQTDSFRLLGEDLPDLQLVYAAGNLSTTNAFYAYRWYKNDELIPGATSSSLATTGNGLYKLVVSNIWDCTDTATYQLGPTGIEPSLLQEKVTIWPNPAGDLLHVEAPGPLHLSLVTLTGQVLLQQKNTNLLFLSGIAPGLYFLKVADREGNPIRTEKVVKRME